MAIVLSGTTNDILVNGVSVATDAEVSSAVANGVAPKANITDLKEIGVGQTWQDLTASRASGVTYTNSTGKPIVVDLYFNSPSTGAIRGLTVDGMFTAMGSSYPGVAITVSKVIPNGSTYSSSFLGNLVLWSELR